MIEVIIYISQEHDSLCKTLHNKALILLGTACLLTSTPNWNSIDYRTYDTE